MDQQVKKLPASQETRETQIRSLGQGRSPGEGNGNHSSILAWKISWQRSLVGYSLMGRKELDMTERLSTAQHVEITNTLFPSFTYLI